MNNTGVTIVIDANPLLSALLGGKARAILLSGKFRFITSEYTTWEVKKYIPLVSERTDVAEEELLIAFEHFPITAFQAKEYDDTRLAAEMLIGKRGPKDVDILALALKFDTPVWSEDKDLAGIEEIELFRTSDMLNKLSNLINEKLN